MSMVPSFDAVRIQADGSLEVLQTFTCDTDALTDLLADEAPPDIPTDWLAGYDAESEQPTAEHCVPPDVVLKALQWVKDNHGSNEMLGYDIDGVTTLCTFAKESQAQIVMTYV